MDKKKSLLSMAIVLLVVTGCAQQTQKGEAEKSLSKIDQFVAKKGAIVSFQDYSLDNLALQYGGYAESKIRKISSGSESGYFLRLSHKGKYDEKIASIAHEDLLELIQANDVLKGELMDDVSKSPEYLEKKFITDDGFQLGYYVSNGKFQWYMVLERYGSGNTIFLKNNEGFESLLVAAKTRIAGLKN